MDCGICMEPITKDGFSHCKHSHNHKACIRTWIRTAMSNNNARANECARCFTKYNETELNEIGLNKEEIDDLLPKDMQMMKTIIDEIMQGNFENINNLQKVDPIDELIEYFTNRNIAHLRLLEHELHVNIKLRLNMNSETIDNVSVNRSIKSFIPDKYANNHLNNVALDELEYNQSNSSSRGRANLLPINILNDNGVKIFREKIRGQDRTNKLQEYLNQRVFNIYVRLEDPSDIDGYKLSDPPCRGTGCSIMGGGKRRKTLRRKKTTIRRKKQWKNASRHLKGN